MSLTTQTSAVRRWREILYEAAILGFQPTLRNLLHWLSWVFAIGLELGLVVILRDGEIYGWELSLIRFLQRTPERDTIFAIANFLTHTLSLPFLIFFAAVVSIVFRAGLRLDALMLLFTFPLHVLIQFPKALIDRPRPSPAYEGIDGVGGFQSFPSGHAEYVISFYGYLTYVVLQHLDRRWQKIAVVAAWVVLVIATGLGRLATGRHWPIDIFASYAFGFGILSGLLWLRRSIQLAIAVVDTRYSNSDRHNQKDQES